ncbi:MAG: imidazoleglycerol-phosphate dehydratase [Alkalinema sp. CACIAM 70d]|nr:MAG: imidazoleglycerol-phosphate dehydratase [Alkalinema sp. CACIAM 70d]
MILVFDIDGVIRDVAGSYRRALADTVEQFTQGAYRPTPQDIDALKSEGLWNNDWEASQELIYRHFEQQGQPRSQVDLSYDTIVAFFQGKYRGEQPDGTWTGYITQEPLLVDAAYFDALTAAEVKWGFFSGATTASATFVLTQRVGLRSPLLVAMEDAPGKPDPTGLFAALTQLGEHPGDRPVAYVGDTVADMHTVGQARQMQPDRRWIGLGVLPPHIAADADRREAYSERLRQAGADRVVSSVREITPTWLDGIL